MLRIPECRRLTQILVLGLLILAPASFFFCQAWFNPGLEFLVPSMRGRWILHDPDELFPARNSGEVAFRRRFDLKLAPVQCRIDVRAASRFRISVNGHVLEEDSQQPPRNWKIRRTYDIAPFLGQSGNHIEIHVTNGHGLPALLVEASPGMDAGIHVQSDAQWESAQSPDYSSWRRCVYPNQEPPVFGEANSAVQKPPLLPLYAVAFVVYSILVLLSLNPWQIFYRRPASSSGSGLRTARVFLALGIAAVLGLHIHNLLSYPYSRSYFDYEAHVAYVQYVAQHWRVPIATQGWEMYQPPLYYFVSAIVYTVAGGTLREPASLKMVQAIGTLSGLACVLLAWLTLRVCAKDKPWVWILGAGTVAFMPMVLYASPMISNEMFSAAMMSFALYWLIRYGFRDAVSFKQAAGMGLVFGLALLSKYTAFLLFLVAGAVLFIRILIRKGQRRREGAVLLVFCAMTVAISGWFYARNVIQFGKPFIANWDDESGFYWEQPPGYRTPGFYLKVGSVFTKHPERSRWSSFWDGYHGSMWMDTHYNMIDFRDQKANALGTVILALALLPASAMCLGFAGSLRRIVRCRQFGADFALVLSSIVTMLVLIWYTLQIPYITTLKATYSLSLIPAFAVFAGFGLYQMAQNLGKYAAVLHVCLAALFVLIGYLFWFRPQ